MSTSLDLTNNVLMVSSVSFADASDEHAHFHAMRGRLQALRAILDHLNVALTSLNETHAFIGIQVQDLEVYIASLAPVGNDAPTAGDGPVKCNKMGEHQHSSQGLLRFWNKFRPVRNAL